MAMFLVFATLYFYYRASIPIKFMSWLIGAFLFVFLIGFVLSQVDLNRFSSGRLTMWAFKMQMFASASLTEQLFGQGFGSDLVEVHGWYGEKDSHNNFIRVLTEFGAFGLVLLMVCLSYLYRALKTSASKALFFGYLVTGMLSNGVLFRLVPGYIVFMVMAALECGDGNGKVTAK
ncbi:hypothetical protein KUV89_09330 [Marinobacter hydrocarbonoclasticus]|nr:hypothetical protein [Marinobacter nauticus]